jgi:membrane-bound metal-dependent hydrolase YbcI (DUF457 family)
MMPSMRNRQTLDEKEIKDLRKYLRQSKRALPVYSAILFVICAVLFVLTRFISVPLPITGLLIGVALFSVLGDAINIAYIKWKLRGIDSQISN